MAGAPIGNTNAANGRRFRKALERELARRYGDVDEGLGVIAKKLVDLTEDPQSARDACKEIADRFDGKPHQSVTAEVEVTTVVVKDG